MPRKSSGQKLRFGSEGSEAEAIFETMRTTFKQNIVRPELVEKEAFVTVLKGHENDPEWIKANFSDIIVAMEDTAHRIYLTSQLEAGKRALEAGFRTYSQGHSGDELLTFIEDNFVSLDALFLGIQQGRKSRGGDAFEFFLENLLKALGYPFETQADVIGKVDFVLPTKEHFLAFPMDCINLPAKRTLRERWRQITTEGNKGLHFFLATLDEDKSPEDLKQMLDARIYMVVPKSVKQSVKTYANAPNVITFEELFAYHLDPAMKRWIDRGVIKAY
jgi:hypothetical protein